MYITATFRPTDVGLVAGNFNPPTIRPIGGGDPIDPTGWMMSECQFGIYTVDLSLVPLDHTVAYAIHLEHATDPLIVYNGVFNTDASDLQKLAMAQAAALGALPGITAGTWNFTDANPLITGVTGHEDLGDLVLLLVLRTNESLYQETGGYTVLGTITATEGFTQSYTPPLELTPPWRGDNQHFLMVSPDGVVPAGLRISFSVASDTGFQIPLTLWYPNGHPFRDHMVTSIPGHFISMGYMRGSLMQQPGIIQEVTKAILPYNGAMMWDLSVAPQVIWWEALDGVSVLPSDAQITVHAKNRSHLQGHQLAQFDGTTWLMNDADLPVHEGNFFMLTMSLTAGAVDIPAGTCRLRGSPGGGVAHEAVFHTPFTPAGTEDLSVHIQADGTLSPHTYWASTRRLIDEDNFRPVRNALGVTAPNLTSMISNIVDSYLQEMLWQSRMTSRQTNIFLGSHLIPAKHLKFNSTTNPIASASFSGDLKGLDPIKFQVMLLGNFPAAGWGINKVDLGEFRAGGVWFPRTPAEMLADCISAGVLNDGQTLEELDVACMEGATYKAYSDTGVTPGVITLNFTEARIGTVPFVQTLQVDETESTICYWYWDKEGRCLCNPLNRKDAWDVKLTEQGYHPDNAEKRAGDILSGLRQPLHERLVWEHIPNSGAALIFEWEGSPLPATGPDGAEYIQLRYPEYTSAGVSWNDHPLDPPRIRLYGDGNGGISMVWNAAQDPAYGEQMPEGHLVATCNHTGIAGWLTITNPEANTVKRIEVRADSGCYIYTRDGRIVSEGGGPIYTTETAGGGGWDTVIPGGLVEGQAGWVLDQVRGQMQTFLTNVQQLFAQAYMAGQVNVPLQVRAGEPIDLYEDTDMDDIMFPVGAEWSQRLSEPNVHVWFTAKTDPKKTAVIDVEGSIFDVANGVIKLNLTRAQLNIKAGTQIDWQLQYRKMDPLTTPPTLVKRSQMLFGKAYVRHTFKNE